MKEELIKHVGHGAVFSLADLVTLEAGKVNSRTLSQMPGCKITVFAIDADEGMSSHAAPGDALITVLEGTGEITVEGVAHRLDAGESIVMTAGSPHSVRGITPFKMQLTVVKPVAPAAVGES
ncbi:cupin domain-containing protein [Slackia exigua]|uniref:cupin domain-containing protein n=1 Tax=Slackia exigua TaxID=84109 RepID=UPI00254FDBF0|nr:cupin domain-containing protein [Slackia exigua]MDK7724289.1 cupin domain-containing protein [Slackia exigua]MDK7725617.1 cupin domain-containing protein [Slackia exigua]